MAPPSEPDNRVKLKLTSHDGEIDPPPAGYEFILEPAAQALTECVENLHEDALCRLFTEEALSDKALLDIARNLSKDVAADTRCRGEAPLTLVHKEDGGWKSNKPVPWLLLAADVLDFLAITIGSGYQLRVERSL